MAGNGLVHSGMARLVRYGEERCGQPQPGKAWCGKAGVVENGAARLGKMRSGAAGVDGPGDVRRGWLG